ncbi:hypothetical protein B0H16DRAFT_1687755 [Mycena metata]|uniref:Uncharacterized protein n=1 Tax=Mycena metata TaxID=1033252 RepID=A0AAD7JI70_9AGAR|nr:hypothetical protein B0H16DRAFT_1687755 [Mycena metata]
MEGKNAHAQQQGNPPGKSGVSEENQAIMKILEYAAKEGVEAAAKNGEKAFTSKFIKTINILRGEGQNDIVWAIEPNEQETGADLQIQWEAVHDGKTRTEMCNLQLKLLYENWSVYQGVIGRSQEAKSGQAQKNFLTKQQQGMDKQWHKDLNLFFDAWYKSTSEVKQYQAVSLLNCAYGNNAQDAKRKIEATEETTTAGYLVIDNRAFLVKNELQVRVVPITKFGQTIRRDSPLLFLEAKDSAAKLKDILNELNPSSLDSLIKEHGGPISDILGWHEADRRALHTWEQEQRAAQDALHN